MSEWISIEARIPDEWVPVLVYEPLRERMNVDYIVVFEDMSPPYIWGRRPVDDIEKITHWMPLPSPPKE